MTGFLRRLAERFIRPAGCVCDLPPRAARNRHAFYRRQGLTGRCIRRWAS